jgi:alpha-ribazole phosphatase
MHLYLIRHPRPNDATGRCYGRQELSVSAAALHSAVAGIRSQIPARVLCHAEIFSSPASRCLALARELAAPREPLIADGLLEMNFGSWEGQPWKAIPRDQLDAWAADVWRHRPGGAESAAMVAERWNRWSSEIQGTVAGAAIAVTHAGVIRVALVCAGRLRTAQWASASIEFGGVYCIDLAVSHVHGAAAPGIQG